MSATETVVFRAVLDAREFNTGVGTMRSEVEKAGAAVTGGSVAVKGFQGSVEKAATATSGMASAFGGMGGKAGAAFGAVSNLASAFLAGGPLLVGIAAAATLIGRFAQDMGAAEAAARKASDEMQKQKLADYAAKWERLRDAVRDTAIEFQTIGMKAEEARATAAAARVGPAVDAREQAQLDLTTVEQNKLLAKNRIREIESKKNMTENDVLDAMRAKRSMENLEREAVVIRERLKVALVEEANTKDQYRLAEAQLKAARDKAAEEEAARAALRKERETKQTRARAEREGVATSSEIAAIYAEIDPTGLRAMRKEEAERQAYLVGREERMQEKIAANKEKWAAEERNVEKANSDYQIELARKVEEERQKAAKESADRIANLWKSAWDDYRAFAESAINSAASSFVGALESMAAGQKVQFELLAAGFIKQMGLQLIGIGVKQAFEGAGFIWNGIAGHDPVAVTAGAKLVAQGTAAVAAGTAMAASGAVMSGRIASASSGGGGGGGGSSGGRLESRDRERRAGGGGDRGESQTVVVNFNGGTQMGDPTERARTLARDARRVNREVYTPRRRR